MIARSDLRYVARPADAALFLRVLATLAAIRGLLHRVTLPALLRLLDPGTGVRLDPSRLDQVVKFSDFLVYDLFRSPTPCLYRSLVLFRYLRMMGMEVRIAFAVKEEADRLAGHAWILRGQEPFLDRGGPAEDYVPVLIYPPEPEGAGSPGKIAS